MKSDDEAIAQVSKSLGALYLLANEYADSLKHMEIANTIYRKRSGIKINDNIRYRNNRLTKKL